MIFKVGQKVRIKKGIYDIENETGEYVCPETSTYLEGKIFTISEEDYEFDGCYRLAEDRDDFYWYWEWLEPIGEALEEFE